MRTRTLLLVVALLATGVTTISAQPRGQHRRAQFQQKDICVQLYSVRDIMGNDEKYAQNHERVFKALKSFGYTSTEAANYNDGKFYGVSPEQYRKDNLAAGLTPLSSHVGHWPSETELAKHDFTEALKWWDKCIAAHKKAGMKYIVCPWGEVPKNLQIGQSMCDFLSVVGKKVKEAGMQFGYHTHSHEFQKVEGQIWIEYMLNHIPAENMFWQMDVYWCVMAQQAPVEWFKKYPGRCKMLHIKDHYEIGESGMVGFDAIFRNAKTCGLEDYVVELEETDGTIDSVEGLRRSARYLLRQPFVRSHYPVK